MKDFVLNLDRPRRLKFDFDALPIVLEKFRDIEIKDSSELFDLVGRDTLTFAWAGLIHEDKDLTIEKAKQLLNAAIPDNHGMLDIITIVFEAFSRDFIGEGKKTIETKSEEQGSPPSESESVEMNLKV